MEKIFKKSLAIMVSAALCLTAFIGCLTVNAGGETNPNYIITAKDGKAGETVTVNVDGDNLTGVCGQQLFINIPKDLVIVSVQDEKGNDYKEDDGKNGGDYKKVEVGTVQQVRFIDIINFEDEVVTSEFHIVFKLTIPQTAEDGAEYNIVFDAKTIFGDSDGNPITATLTPATITVLCTHAWEFVSATPAVDGGENGKVNLKCSKCGEKKEEFVTYKSASTLAQSAIGCDSTTQLILRTSVANYTGSSAGYVIVTHKFADNTTKDVTLTYSVADAKEKDGYYQWIIPVNTKNFTDTFSTVFYTKLDDVWYSGEVRTFSIKDLAMGIVKATDSQYEKLRPVAADLLTMGAAAQKKFSYATGNLANSELIGDYAQYVTTTVPSVEVTAENYIRNTDGVASGDKLAVAVPSISLADSLSFNYSIVCTKYNDVESLTNLKMVVTYTSYNGQPVSKEITDYVTTENDGVPTKFNFVYSVTAPNMRVPISVQIFNGDTAVSAVNTFSVEAVLAKVKNGDSSNAALVNAIMNYSDSAVESFN